MNKLITPTSSDIINLILRFDYLKPSSIIMLNEYSDILFSDDFKIKFKTHFYSKPFIQKNKFDFKYENNNKCLILSFTETKLNYLKIQIQDKILLEIQ